MKLKNGGMLLLTAFIWGTAFVAQSVGMDYLGPFSFNGIRCLIGAVALLPCIWFLNRMNKDTETDCSEKEKSGKDLITGGIACGVLLFTAGSLQQAGIQYTTAGKAGFITAFYIVIVPVLGIFLHKKIKWKVWMAVLLALVGLYFLCITESFSIGKGDILVFLCALVFSVHILVIDHFSPKVDGVKMSCIQFFVSGILSLPFMFVLETPRLVAVAAAWIILWCCIYITDTWTEECESGGSIADFKPGILFFGTCGLDHTWRTFVIQRIVRVYTDVSSNYTGTASG